MSTDGPFRGRPAPATLGSMEQPPSRPDGFRRERTRAIPLAVLAVAVLVAVGAVSALIYVLFKTTTGPGQTLRQYYQAVSSRDCEMAYGLLSSSLRKTQREEPFCRRVERVVENGAPRDVEIRTVVGFGEPPARFARVTVEEIGRNASDEPVTWRMVREGDAWLVAQFPDTGRCEVRKPPRHCTPL